MSQAGAVIVNFRKMVKNTEYPGRLMEEKIQAARRKRQAAIALLLLLAILVARIAWEWA
jgi:hypothetical protein